MLALNFARVVLVRAATAESIYHCLATKWSYSSEWCLPQVAEDPDAHK